VRLQQTDRGADSAAERHQKRVEIFPRQKPGEHFLTDQPATRLQRIAMPTIPVARVLARRSCIAVIREQRTASQKLRKQKKSRAVAASEYPGSNQRCSMR
jgi:hypothetical protein